MDWGKLHRTKLMLICGELGIDLGKSMPKKQFVEAIQQGGFEDEDIVECWEELKCKAEEGKRKRKEQIEIEERKYEEIEI